MFPYEAFSCIEEIDKQINFPSYDQFYSKLKEANIPSQDYHEAKAEYEKRQELPDDHPDKIRTFRDWLIYYNCLDVRPLCQAIKNSFDSLFKLFGIDPTN